MHVPIRLNRSLNYVIKKCPSDLVRCNIVRITQEAVKKTIFQNNIEHFRLWIKKCILLKKHALGHVNYNSDFLLTLTYFSKLVNS